MKKHPFTYLYVLTALSTFFFFLLTFYDPAYIREKIEAKTFDLRLALRSALRKTGPPSDIAIVYIDEKSLAEIGRWPWRRDVVAQLVRKISSGGPKVIGLDIMLSERESEESDQQLSMAIKEAGNVVLPLSFVIPRDQTGKGIEPPDFVSDSAFMKIKSVKGIAWRRWAFKAVKAVPPLPELARYAILGSVNYFPDLDGVMRWGVMYVCLVDDCYPHFALQVARTALNVGMKEVVLFGGSGIDIGGHFLRTDLSGRVLINYQEGREGFPSVSASDVLAGRVPEEFFKGKIVMVGASAFATYDRKMTPFSPDAPGVSINASITDNILRTGFLKKSPGLIELLSILFTGVLLGLVLPRLRPLAGFGVALLCVFLYAGTGVAALVYKGVWINLTYPLANMLIIYNGQTFIRFLFEERRAREIRRIFSRYVSPRIVEVLIDNPRDCKAGRRHKGGDNPLCRYRGVYRAVGEDGT